MSETVRIDKWLWVVRLYKTRTLAGEACRGGKVKMDGHAIKASKEIKVGDIIEVHLPLVNKTIEVKNLGTNRVSAKLVENLLLDHTPAEEYERVQLMKEFNVERRQRGLGRPTKKDRREIDHLKENN
ncbi:MAG: RNA-binding protein [Bacteroidetes bacterium HGW-Bacteroidetes-1]|jgi:ribosome-associated heat shock protein Hsp15|nr:MAG: RNA-binding protein [Bacteroidetes bacterium HGW-Bacteroidetes-1]